MKQVTILLLVAVLAGCVPAPTPEPEPDYLGGQELHFPLMMVAPWEWQRTGYGWPPQSLVSDRELRHRGMWRYSWGLGDCLTVIPMVFDGHDLPSPKTLARCAATAQVLLVFNEPEWGSQGNTLPAKGAKALRYLEQHWPGELWCCGTLSSHPGWLNAMLTAYKAEFGEMPRITGISLHIYVSDGFKTESPDDPKWLERSQAELAGYRAVVERWGLPQRFVVTECCALHGENLNPVMDAYMVWLRSQPDVESVAWFSARYSGFADSNLLTKGGGLTPLGEDWLKWRWR